MKLRCAHCTKQLGIRSRFDVKAEIRAARTACRTALVISIFDQKVKTLITYVQEMIVALISARRMGLRQRFR